MVSEASGRHQTASSQNLDEISANHLADSSGEEFFGDAIEEPAVTDLNSDQSSATSNGDDSSHGSAGENRCKQQ
jgi:hypothetical protein